MNGKREGQGRYIYTDGSVYVGECSENYWHGKGMFTYEKDNALGLLKYEGSFDSGEFSGHGSMLY